ncbi:MAG: methylmalonyl Co-A mutase-associated GTPase MeaB [bacterium]|nr:methylmalonyl Co-A mutase-associated GTPase MeaB [bacterium]
MTAGGHRAGGLGLDEFEAGVVAGDRAVLGRAITLVESGREDHQRLAQELLARLLPRTGAAHRVGVTGVPGAGKSTLIDVLGTRLTSQGHRVAVLAIDPSSSLTGGSILGDKTRMARLAADPAAFIRPSPSARTLGGVGRKTRETMLLCEAAGHDVVLVETVGVGQSETVVAEMVDVFLLITLAGAGDELQGIKRGVMELADLVAVNKADGDNRAAAGLAAAEIRNALHFMRPPHPDWIVPVTCVSAATGEGLDDLWGELVRHRDTMTANGALAERRQSQQLRWMWSLVEDNLREGLRHDPAVRRLLPDLERHVRAGEMPPGLAARLLLDARSN